MSIKNEKGKSGLLVFCSFIFIAILNYGYQFVAGRFLSPEEYGTMYSMFSASNIALIAGGIMQTAIARSFAIDKFSKNEYKMLLIWHCVIQGVIAVALGTVLTCLGYNFFDVVCISVYVFCANLSLYWIGITQGKKRFVIFVALCTVVPFSKIFASLVLILGGHYDISFLVMAAAGVIAHFAGKIIMRKDAYALESSATYRQILKTFQASVIPIGSLAAFSFIHNVVAKSIADDAVAGAYCLAALLGTAMISVPSAITPVVIPYASERKDNRLLITALGASELLACLGGSVFLMLKEPLLTFMFKENGAAAEKYVLPIFIMFIPIVAVHVFIYYLVAIGKKGVLNITCIIALATIIALSCFVLKDVAFMSYVFCGIYSVAAVILGIFAFFNKKERINPDGSVKS